MRGSSLYGRVIQLKPSNFSRVMNTLRVSLLGGFSVCRDEAAVSGFRSQKACSLLAYLMLYRQRAHPRAILANLFWGDSSDARALANLRSELYYLRRLLEGPKKRFAKYLLTEGATVRFNSQSAYWLDVAEFEKKLACAHNISGEERAELLGQAVSLYQGDLLTGFYDDWVLIERQHFKDLYVQVLKELIAHEQERQQYDRAIALTRRALEANFFHEEFHQTLMRLYALSGDRTAALQQYAECESGLKRELNIDPLPETRALHEKISHGESLVPQTEAVSVREPPHNLPRALSRFVGRKREITAIKRLVSGTHLVTLTGIGGGGKTRLALQVATDLVREYAEGVWWVDLTALTDPALVLQTVAAALGVREEPGQSLLETLCDHLQPKNLLLVLDNCEHLLASCAQMTGILLQRCPNLRVLATSRESLGLTRETVWKTPPLLLPNLEDLPSADEELVLTLTRYEAIELFVERATSSDPGFALTSQNARTIAEICHRLEGIPLAIELAAARVKVISVEEIAERLNDALGLLTQGSRTALSKHQTLRATLDWSYQLLSEPEQILLRRLSVFAGGFIVWAVEGVCAEAPIDEFEAVDVLTQLVNKSLVNVSNEGGKVRYRLVETVRQYAGEKLVGSGEAELVRGKHLDFFLRLAERAEPELNGPQQVIWLDRLEAEHSNLRVALEWSRTGEDEVEAGLKLAAALRLFWEIRGYMGEGRECLEALLAVSENDRELTLWRARVFLDLGYFMYRQDNYTQASTLCEKSLALFQELGEKTHFARALNVLGNIAIDRGDFARARALHEESLAARRELGIQRGIAESLGNLGYVANCQEDYPEAITLFEESLSVCQELGYRRGIAWALINLGRAQWRLGNYGRAAALCEESMAISQELGDKGRINYALVTLGLVVNDQGEREQGKTLLRESLILSREVADRWAIAQGLEGLAKVACGEGRLGRVAQLGGAAEALRQAINSPLQPADHADYESLMTAARIGLGEEAFTKAWALGHAMTLAQAIGYALEETY